MMHQDSKEILKVGSEGGSISIYHKIPTSTYYYNFSEMGYEDLEIDPVNRNSEGFNSLEEALNQLEKEYPQLWNLYPVFVEENIKTTLLKFVKRFNKTNELLTKDRWVNILEEDLQ